MSVFCTIAVFLHSRRWRAGGGDGVVSVGERYGRVVDLEIEMERRGLVNIVEVQ